MFINVLLPEPLEPMMATNSPGKIVQRNAAHGMNVHFAGVIRLVDVVELDDGFGLHGNLLQLNRQRRAGIRRRTDWNSPPPAASGSITPVTTFAPASKPETTSVEMPSLMPVLICTASSFADGPSPFST